MSYYPILAAPYCKSRVTLYNFPPNNWEYSNETNQYIHHSFIKDGKWNHELIDELSFGKCQIIDPSSCDLSLSKDSINLLSLSEVKLPNTSKILPKLSTTKTNKPDWRSTLELFSDSSKTSYQGEINPFPSMASLLTFAPFLQFGTHVENYLLLLSLEAKPINRQVLLEIYDAKTKRLIATEVVFSNKINIISLNGKGITDKILPVVICREMAAIPLYFSCANQGEFLSLEHTHPPASLVVHGNYFSAQKYLKEYWLSECKLP